MAKRDLAELKIPATAAFIPVASAWRPRSGASWV